MGGESHVHTLHYWLHVAIKQEKGAGLKLKSGKYCVPEILPGISLSDARHPCLFRSGQQPATEIRKQGSGANINSESDTPHLAKLDQLWESEILSQMESGRQFLEFESPGVPCNGRLSWLIATCAWHDRAYTGPYSVNFQHYKCPGYSR